MVVDREEKKRKAKATAAERAMQVVRRRAMKTVVVVVGLLGDFVADERESSVSKERRAADGFAGSSSWVGIGVGLVMDKESEPIVAKAELQVLNYSKRSREKSSLFVSREDHGVILGG